MITLGGGGIVQNTALHTGLLHSLGVIVSYQGQGPASCQIEILALDYKNAKIKINTTNNNSVGQTIAQIM